MEEAKPNWWAQYQQDREILTQQVNQLTRDVSALTANVKNLVENQKSIIDKDNRPFQWGAFVSAIVGAGVFAGLLINPLYNNMHEIQDFQVRVTNHMLEHAEDSGRIIADLEWLKLETNRGYQHHESEWNRVKDAANADLENDINRIHDCGENTKNMLMDYMTRDLDYMKKEE